MIQTDKLQRPDGGPVELTKQSAAKVWAMINVDGTTNASFNVSSIIDGSAGGQNKYVGFINGMIGPSYSAPNANTTQGRTSNAALQNRGANGLYLSNYTQPGANSDDGNDLTVHGELT